MGASTPHTERPCFQVDIQPYSGDLGKESQSKILYQGYALFCDYEELASGQQYHIRVCYKLKGGVSPWSKPCVFESGALPSTGKDIHRAINNWNEEQLIDILKQSKVSVDIPNDEGHSPLMHVSKKGYTNLAKILLEHGADTTFTTSSGKTAMSMACFFGHVEMVELLISYHAPWDIPDKAGLYPLHTSVSGGNLEVVKFFLDKGVKPDLLEVSTKWTPLMRGVVVGVGQEIVELLLTRGAATDARDEEHKTPLMLAVINGREQLVETLLKFGSDPYVCNKYGKNAVDFAATLATDSLSSKHNKIMKLLEKFIH